MLNNTGVNKVDPIKLGEYILQLNSLKSDIRAYVYTRPLKDQNCGPNIGKMASIDKYFENIQKSLEQLIDNTAKYFEKRKEEIEDNENKATEAVNH